MESEYTFEKADGSSLKMAVVPIPVDLTDLDDNQIKLIRVLSKAVQAMAPICARQRLANALDTYPKVRSTEHEGIWNFFSAGLTTYDLYGNAHKDVQTLGIGPEGPGQGLYPVDITKAEAESLPKNKHSIVVKEESVLKVVPNSEYFKEELERVDHYLEQAQELASGKLLDLIKTTRKALLDESQENLDEQLQAWMNNTNEIDIIFDTAREEGADNLLSARGQAGAGVFRVNKKYAELTKTLTQMMPELDKAAPWTYKADNISTPCVRFVDVINWSGDFISLPATVLAQNLPNEQERKDKFGCISIMYANVTEELKKLTWPLIVEEFFVEEDDFVDSDYMENLMTAVHELGHATSRVTFSESPADVFEEYDVLEEARAETFALWGLQHLQKEGIITQEQERSGYHVMLATLVGALCNPPKAHAGARNMMFHYFLKHGAIIEEKGKFRIDIERMREECGELLKEIADVRSEGDVEGFAQLKNYISLERKAEFEKRFEKIPRGRIAVLPDITSQGEATYPDRFRDAPGSLERWFMQTNS